ncbi:hypothetical protein GGS23DRAFT_609131 [Durotheca rogersii]|uniref:uncharacterized protein n=1 Tax=Durotheca rogersii TaxID=419775 RepID=UPI00221EA75E|nr:uncharacterized protein GGS23DRAFT_609131 [Durotheca rogersii]KAI5868408.1 hypothetical protein GGS23DRAFT_609131 [Durotheca rogersii]
MNAGHQVAGVGPQANHDQVVAYQVHRPTQRGILSLATETLYKISSYLTVTEYGNVRLTCRDLESRLFDDFAKEFFGARQFRITEDCLRTLTNISRSRLNVYVTELIISVANPGLEYRDSFTAVPPHLYAHKHLNHWPLVVTDRGFQLLTVALHGLPNVQAIGIRDFSFVGRYRYKGSPPWYSSMAKRFIIVPSTLPPEPEIERRTLTDYCNLENCLGGHPIYTYHLFLMILRVMGSIARVHRLPTRLEMIFKWGYMPCEYLTIPHGIQLQASHFLGKLKVLFLQFTPVTDLSFVTPPGGGISPCSTLPLMRLLSQTPSLQHLRLDFTSYDLLNADGPGQTLRWLAGETQERFSTGSSSLLVYPPLPPAPTFQHLERFDFGYGIVRPSDLLNFYLKYKSTLREISLHAASLVTQQPELKEDVSEWAKFIDQLADLEELGLQIKTINLSKLTERYYMETRDDNGWFKTYFRHPGALWGAPSQKLYIMTWTGASLKLAQRDLKPWIFVNLDDDLHYERPGRSSSPAGLVNNQWA